MTTRWVLARVGTADPVLAALEVTTPPATTPWPAKGATGPAAGVVFASRAGGTVSGTHRKVRFTTAVTVGAAGAVFEDCEFPSWSLVRRNDNGPATFSRCTFVGGLSLSSARSVLLFRCRVVGKGGGDLLHITSDSGALCTDIAIRDTWIGDAVLTPDDHLDGIQVRGVHNLMVERCSIDIGRWRTTTNGGLNAAVFLETANGGNSWVTVRDSYLNGGAYTLMVGTSGHTGLQLLHNRFGPDGRYGDVVLTKVTPKRAVDNLQLATGRQAGGLPVIA